MIGHKLSQRSQIWKKLNIAVFIRKSAILSIKNACFPHIFASKLVKYHEIIPTKHFKGVLLSEKTSQSCENTLKYD